MKAEVHRAKWFCLLLYKSDASKNVCRNKAHILQPAVSRLYQAIFPQPTKLKVMIFYTDMNYITTLPFQHITTLTHYHDVTNISAWFTVLHVFTAC